MLRRLFLVCLVAAVLAACVIFDESRVPRTATVTAVASAEPAPVVRILASWDRRDPDVRGVQAIELIAPGGQTYVPSERDQHITSRPYNYTALPRPRGMGATSAVPEDFSLLRSNDREGEILNQTAAIVIPDPENYRQMPEQWSVSVIFSGPAQKTKTITIPAPPIL